MCLQGPALSSRGYSSPRKGRNACRKASHSADYGKGTALKHPILQPHQLEVIQKHPARLLFSLPFLFPLQALAFHKGLQKRLFHQSSEHLNMSPPSSQQQASLHLPLLFNVCPPVKTPMCSPIKAILRVSSSSLGHPAIHVVPTVRTPPIPRCPFSSSPCCPYHVPAGGRRRCGRSPWLVSPVLTVVHLPHATTYPAPNKG